MFGRNGCSHKFDVELPVIGTEIDEHGKCTEREHVREIRLEIIGGKNDFIAGADAYASKREFHGGGAAAAKPDVLDTVKLPGAER